MPSCEFCGCKVSKDAFEIINEPAFGIYYCGKSECEESLKEFKEEYSEENKKE